MTIRLICFILNTQVTSTCTHRIVASSGEFIGVLNLAVAPLSTFFFFALTCRCHSRPVAGVRVPLVIAMCVRVCARLSLSGGVLLRTMSVESSTSVPPLAVCCCCLWLVTPLVDCSIGDEMCSHSSRSLPVHDWQIRARASHSNERPCV